MIYGLAAALGWGFADFTGAVGGRRIGSLPTVLIAQALSAIAMTAIMVGGGYDPGVMSPYIGFVVLNGLASGGAYLTHYQALQLGPVAVVSPIGATYAFVGVGLAVLVLGERPGIAATRGRRHHGDRRDAHLDRYREAAGRHAHQATRAAVGIVTSAVLFGIGGFFLGYFAQEVGWVPGLWASRCAQVAMFTALSLVRRREFGRVGWNAGLAMAIGSGAADLLGVVAYSSGRREGCCRSC